MLRLIRYDLLQAVREKAVLFWMLAFPILLGFLYHISVSSQFRAAGDTLVVQAGAEGFRYVKEVSFNGHSFSGMETCFFALIGMTCLYGGILGRNHAAELQANLSALGARNSISPVPWMRMLLAKMLSGILVTTCCAGAVTGFLAYVTGDIRIDGAEGWVMLICLMGSAIGTAFGIAIGSIGKWSREVKSVLHSLLSMAMAVLAGLIAADGSYRLRQYAPILDRMNPAAVISDAFYCVCIYENPGQLGQDLLILGGMIVLLLGAVYFGIRRTGYDSI